MKNISILLVIVSSLLFGCEKKASVVTLKEFAEISQKFSTKITGFEAKQDPSNTDLFMKMIDSAENQKTLADSALINKFKLVKDTIYLDFKQTKNLEKIKVLKVWVVGITFDEVAIEATVQAVDNSSFMGPYTSASIYDKTGKRMEVGGGIGGPSDKKLVAGEIYKFTGKIDNLHQLATLKSLNFDEDIKKW